VRISSLDQAQFCGRSAALAAKHGAGRPAAMSTAFHARCAQTDGAERQIAALTDDERKEVFEWHKPATVVIDHVTLDYAEAMKELQVGLSRWGEFEPYDRKPIARGTADMVWIAVMNGQRIAFVGDIKKTIFTVEGPDTLQLQAYGWAAAKLHECDGFMTGLWLATEGEWIWSEELVLFDTPRAELIWERIFHAATNDTSEAVTGPHCEGCYGRTHCEEYLIPAAALVRANLPAVGEAALSDPARAGALLAQVSAAEKLLAAWKENLKAAVKRGEVKVSDGNGLRWVPIMHKGKETIDREKLLLELGDDAQRFIKRGARYPQMHWVKA
jgi:hypothetical protein